MAKSFPLEVKPQILQWARNRAGLDVPALAGKMKIEPEELQGWESGEGHPSFSQARKLAQKTYLPFGYLFLHEPVDEKLGIADFRTFPGRGEFTPSVNLLDVLHTAQLQQGWFREYLITENSEEPLSCFQSAPEADENKVAWQIRDFFGWDELQFKPHGSPDTFLRECVNSAHDKGFLISRSGKVGDNTRRPLDNKEFRGFALFDEYAPLVFINTKRDSHHARLFTLAHELAHLFRRNSGIDSAKWEGAHNNNIDAEETICNRIAASALMPSKYFNEKWANANGDERQKIEKMSRIFKVSKMATAIRAFDTKNISKSLCNAVCAEEKVQYEEFIKQEGKKTKSGGQYSTLLFNRLPGGERFARAVVASVGSGNLRHTDAFDLLSVSQNSFYSCVERLGW